MENYRFFMKKYEGSFWSKNLHKWPKIGQNAQQVHLLAQKGLFRTEMVKMTQHKKNQDEKS